jgi:hypothetical protein
MTINSLILALRLIAADTVRVAPAVFYRIFYKNELRIRCERLHAAQCGTEGAGTIL